MITFLATIFVFGLMIFFHELGHFVVAKLTGVRVLEFSVGMGSKLFSFRHGSTLYAMRLLPVGGYVRMAGMDPEEMRTNPSIASDPGSFNNKSLGQRAAVIFAGSFMNFFLAFLLFIYIFTIIGIPKFSNVIGEVMPDKPAAIAGIQAGDRILAVNGQETSDWLALIAEIRPNSNQELQLRLERDGQIVQVPVVPVLDVERNIGQIGIMVDEGTMSVERKGFFTALNLGLTNTYELTVMVVKSLVQMITGRIPADVGGPVLIVSEIGKAASTGMENLLLLAAILSINLGVINLFPIPALDGSRLLFLGFEALRGKPIDPAKENMIHLVGFAFLIFLMVLIAYNDVIRLLGGG
ncbi:MAG: RIP metalloprotease RseP [Heliobacteriaceae bacterium]|nr:RIP metalloprotease RseP [Heliobacteriaceae bacterium]MDD4587245.1 RIP metalloprotease RseP [Heliobacteriaceae bacterium]